MNCTRLSDMSERLTTLEAKVRPAGWPGEWGWRVVRHMLDMAKESPFARSQPSLSSLVSGIGNY